MKAFSSLIAVVFCLIKVTMAKTAREKCPDLLCTAGYIHATFKNGSSPGYISKNFLTNQTFIQLYTSSKHRALLVQLPSVKIYGNLNKVSFNIETVNGPNSSLPFIGAAGLIDPIRLYTPGVAAITAVSELPLGPAESDSALIFGNAVPGESQIWRLSCKHVFSAVWVNQDYSPVSVGFLDLNLGDLVPRVPVPGLAVYGHQVFGVTGNVTALRELVFGNSLDSRISEVILTFVPACV